MSNHTPGPWETLFPGSRYICQSSNRDIIITEMVDFDKEYLSEYKANANLIAAAPEMLEYLEQLYWACEYDCDSLNRHEVAALIAKAKGES